MEKIAIRGGGKQSSKIIDLLKSLGGENFYHLLGICNSSYYLINSDNYIVNKVKNTIDKKSYVLYESLEEYEQSLYEKSLTIINYTDI
jgi:hypothetical protein